MPPRKLPEGAVKPLRAHIQGRLHSETPDGGREHGALEFYLDTLLKVEKWDDRRVLTEALLALRMYWEEGYRPPDNPQGLMTSEIVEMAKEARATLKLARGAMEMLSSLDLTSLRSQPGWKEEVWADTSAAVGSGAAKIMGHAKSYDDDEGDDD